MAAVPVAITYATAPHHLPLALFGAVSAFAGFSWAMALSVPRPGTRAPRLPAAVARRIARHAVTWGLALGLSGAGLALRLGDAPAAAPYLAAPGLALAGFCVGVAAYFPRKPAPPARA